MAPLTQSAFRTKSGSNKKTRFGGFFCSPEQRLLSVSANSPDDYSGVFALGGRLWNFLNGFLAGAPGSAGAPPPGCCSPAGCAGAPERGGPAGRRSPPARGGPLRCRSPLGRGLPPGRLRSPLPRRSPGGLRSPPDGGPLRRGAPLSGPSSRLPGAMLISSSMISSHCSSLLSRSGMARSSRKRRRGSAGGEISVICAL